MRGCLGIGMSVTKIVLKYDRAAPARPLPQLYGFDGPMLLEEMLRERGMLLRPLVYPPLLAGV